MTAAGAKPILFVRCDDEDSFGVGPAAVEGAGGSVAVWNALDPDEPKPSLGSMAGVIVFGSSFNVEHADDQPFMKEVRELTCEAVEDGVPYLGVCFGAQMLAWSLDADVMKAQVREIGFEPIRPLPGAANDRLLAHYEPQDHVFQWHMDTYALPDGAELLVTGDGVEHQAYRVGERAWGVQFHFEIDRAELEHWLTAFGARDDLLATWGKSADAVRAEADRYLATHQDKGREVFERFARLAAP